MKKKTSEMTVAELRARAAEIRAEVNAEGADLDALEAEADEISQRIAQYETEQRRLGIAAYHGHLGPFPGEGGGDGITDAFAAASDDGGSAC